MTSPLENRAYLMNTGTRPDLVMVRGEGSYLWDSAGNRYLDFVQGWAVNSLGHAAPEIAAALAAQANQLISPSPAFHNDRALQLAKVLCERTAMRAAFFASSGAEANEGAIKLARKWGKLYKNGAHEIITTHGAFHGRTLATMAASGKLGWDTLFPPNLPGFPKVPYGDAAAMAAAITPRSVALMVEPIQGEAGVIVPPSDYLQNLRRMADEHDLLLILDEVQTGVGRTGTFLAQEQAGVRADITTLGKGLGGGVPVSALLANERANCFSPGEQGGTYAGNPLMAAVAIAIVQTVDDEFLQRVRERGEQLRQGLERIAQGIAGSVVRGLGLLQALVLPDERTEAVVVKARDQGLLVNAPRPNVLRLMPQLRVSDDEIGAALATLARALQS